MKVDFLITECKEPSRNEGLFGICDDQNGEAAYTDIDHQDQWIATVLNENKIEVTFTAIDNCIVVLKEGTNDKESTCDGILTFDNGLYLVELKNQRTSGWKPEAINQLENTIKLLLSNHTLAEFKHKKAYACNRKHPKFQMMDNEFSKRFYDKTKFRIDVQTTIKIK